MYLVSGDGFIYKVEYKDNSYKIFEQYPVSNDLYGMNYIEKIDNYFYITSYINEKGEIVPKFIRARDLNELISGNYEDLYDMFGFKGTPYYIMLAFFTV